MFKLLFYCSVFTIIIWTILFILNTKLKYEEIIKNKITEIFKDSSAVIYLFGSRVKGLTRRGSDLDIGIENIGSDEFLTKKREFFLFLEESIVPF